MTRNEEPAPAPVPAPVPVIVFDVNETLLDITALEPLFADIFGDAAVLRTWFAELILYSQTMTLSGLYVPFGQLAAGVLRMVAANRGITVVGEEMAQLTEQLGTLPAHPDVAPALELLRGAGFRLVTLTNSASGQSPTPLENAGIDGYFARSFSVEAVRKFKPAPETYQYVAKELAIATPEIWMVACHLWDVIGAQVAGCRGAMIERPHNNVLPCKGVPLPDLCAPDLADLAEQIVRQHSNS